ITNGTENSVVLLTSTEKSGEPWLLLLLPYHGNTTLIWKTYFGTAPKRHICLEGSDGFVTSTAAPIATGWSDHVANNRGERLASWYSPWAVPRSDIRCAPPPR